MPEDAASHEVLPLHLWRLLDWTFLLPDPRPASVAYAGALSSDEERALAMLDPGCRRLSETGRQPAAAVEVVLLASPTYRQARAGAAALVPGGWICIRHRRSFRPWRSPVTLAGWRRFLERRGFSEVSVNWFAPGLEHPARIVPATSRGAVMDTLSRHHGLRWGAAKAVVGRLAFMLGLFPVAIAEGAVVARRLEPAGRRGRHELH